MITEVHGVDDLRSLARRKKQPREFRTVAKGKEDVLKGEGWGVERDGKTSVRLWRQKAKDVFLEDRVWSLFYRMGFTHLSGGRGAILALDPKNPEGPTNQIDVVALDNEVAIAVECKSATEPRKSPQFQKDIAAHAGIRERFATAIHKAFPLERHNRVPVLVFFTWDLIVTENDAERAKEAKVVLFNENDLNYYEQLVYHLGPAAKYQFLADMLPGKKVHGLEIKVPALKARMGKHTYYAFSICPEYLLKIAYVSHRTKGKATDVDTYQRMIKKTRLVRIREYITRDGIFPTNIVVSLEGKGTARFEPREPGRDTLTASYGTLHLAPTYRCAWIIDGQHRLFAYSGHERSATSYLNVVAFDGLPPSKQAQLFIDINHEQKSVKRSLLHELYAELHWDAEDFEKRIGAIVSKAVQALTMEQGSPFRDRILLTDDTRTDTACISLESMYSAVNKPGMFVVSKDKEYGPLWGGDNPKTLRRAVDVLQAWFEMIRAGAPEWWNLGAADGGGLAMNDGIAICVDLLRSVFGHLATRGLSLVRLTDEELVEKLRPFGEEVGRYFGNMSDDERRTFRAGSRGIQGQTAGRRQCERALHDRFPEFEPPGLKEELELLDAKTNEQGYGIIQKIEKMLNRTVIETLKQEFGPDDQWWYDGIPTDIRQKGAKRREEEKGAGGREDYFDLVDYREIIRANWSLFQDVLAYGRAKGKDRGTEWVVKLNDMRKIVMHPGGKRPISWAQLQQLREYEVWLTRQVEGTDD